MNTEWFGKYPPKQTISIIINFGYYLIMISCEKLGKDVKGMNIESTGHK